MGKKFIIFFTLFFSFPFNGKAEIIGFRDDLPFRNDLQNDFEGMIEFVQFRSIPPHSTLKLVTHRRALLLMIPKNEYELKTLEVIAYRNEKELGRLRMNSPSFFPGTDQEFIKEYKSPKVKYSTKAWSVPFPAAWMQQGLWLKFIDQHGNSAILSKDKLNFGGASELFLTNFRLGMLSELRKPQELELDPINMANDYFQTIPVAKLKLGTYLPLEIKDKIVMSNGQEYTPSNLSTSIGNWHNGDMREEILKGVFGQGISRANYGITNSALQEQQFYNFKQIQIHSGTGSYSNGKDVVHGGSGGNGLATLDQTLGNEFSHELGHSFNVMHFHGGDMYNFQNENSGWGYDANRNVMLGSLIWNRNKHQKSAPYWKNIFQFNAHPMAGATENGNVSKFTQFTNFTAQVVQQDLESYPVISADSPTGYKIWNDYHKDMIILWNSNYPKPQYFDVSVMTLVGFYDPFGELQSHIYPAIYGNLGYVYSYENQKQEDCWLEVESEYKIDRIPLSSKRFIENKMNLFHVNFIYENIKYKHANIFCNIKGNIKKLSTLKIEQPQSTLLKGVIISDEQISHKKGLFRYLKIKILSSYLLNEHSSISEIFLIDKNGNYLAKDNWYIKYVTSEENAKKLSAKNIIDGNLYSSWHSEYTVGWDAGKPISFPHEIVVDLGDYYDLKESQLEINQSSYFHGIKNYNISASSDNINWHLMAEGVFEKGILTNIVKFDQKANKEIENQIFKRKKRFSPEINENLNLNFYQIKMNNFCLTSADHLLKLYICNLKDENQYWNLNEYGKLLNKGNKKCLHVNKLMNLEKLYFIDCNIADKWKYFPDKRISIKENKNFVLDYSGKNNVILYKFHGGLNQKWDFFLTKNEVKKENYLNIKKIIQHNVTSSTEIIFESFSDTISGYVYESHTPYLNLYENGFIKKNTNVSFKVLQSPKCGIFQMAESYGGFVYLKNTDQCSNINTDNVIIEVTEENNSIKEKKKFSLKLRIK
nr:hypothetical protein GTC16762_26170 [Pigmentibacter ruber]